MNKSKRVIMLEFNELCPPLMDKFIAEGHLPHFKQLRDASECFITDAGEEVKNLEPWIQWITVHTGLSYKEHGIFNLGDGRELASDSIWDVLSKKQMKSWVCGSMNVNYDAEKLRGIVLPDPWSKDVEPSDDAFKPYFNFVRANVQEHTNETFKLGLKEKLSFLMFMATHGLSYQTVKAIIQQLLNERKDSNEGWKRATILDRLQWDVFKHTYKKEKPDFSTFFLNSAAHFQHKYWRHMEPEKFVMKPDSSELSIYGNAVLYAYQSLDHVVKEALAMRDDETAIVMCTALSQQPYTKADAEGGKLFYRPHDFNQLLSELQLPGVVKVSPVMSEEYHLVCESEAAAEMLEAELAEFTVAGESLFLIRREGSDVFSGCCIHHDLDRGTDIERGDQKAAGFYDIFYQADSIKSGMHHPDGLFWISTPKAHHKVHKEKLPLTSVMSKVLNVLPVETAR